MRNCFATTEYMKFQIVSMLNPGDVAQRCPEMGHRSSVEAYIHEGLTRIIQARILKLTR